MLNDQVSIFKRHKGPVNRTQLRIAGKGIWNTFEGGWGVRIETLERGLRVLLKLMGLLLAKHSLEYKREKIMSQLALVRRSANLTFYFWPEYPPVRRG